MPVTRVDGRDFFYREGGSGPAALFIHGFPFDSRMWLAQLDGLADVRWCIAPDLRGFGRSDPVAGGALTMEAHADDLAGFVEALGVDQADVVGLSMGGYVALALVERHPALVRSLALVDTRAGEDSPEGKQNRDRAAHRVVDEGREVLAAEMAAALLAADASVEVRARVKSMIEDTPYETIVGALMGMKLRPDRSPLLETVSVPAAVIVGEEDRLTPPAESESMARALMAAELAVVGGAGHLAPMERPDEVNRVLRTLFERSG